MVKKTAEKSYGGMAARTSSSELLENNPRQNFRLGDITWVKHGGSSWWPAQVIDEASVSSKPKKKTSHDALVRLYGTCEYLYVDPWKSKMEFEMILKEENKAPMEAFHEVLQKELTHFKSPSDHDEEPVSTKAKTSVKKVRKREGLKRSGHGGVKELATTKGSGDEREHQYSADQDQEVWSNATTGVAVQEGKKKKGARQASPSVSRSQHKKGSVDGTHREIKGMVRDILLGDTIARQHAAEMACVDDVVFGIYDATEGKTTLCTTADTEGGRSIKRTGGGLEADSSNAGKRPRKENNSKGNDSKSSPSREGAMGGCEQHSARQIKIMQKLGLVAPSGSPFKRLVAAAHR